jgi:hypothetical protein
MFMAVDHDTGGTNSYEICKNGRPGYDTGLCQILLPKVGVPWQFTEIDAICYHAGSAAYGDYNPYGPGYEVERLQGEPLTDDQATWLGRINAWADAEWGLPNVHYWGPQYGPWQANFHGSVNHRDIHPNPDGLSPTEWASLGAGAPTPDQPRSDVIYREENGKFWEMGLGDYVELPQNVGLGAALNGVTVVPIKTIERVAMGLSAQKQADKFFARFGLTPK